MKDISPSIEEKPPACCKVNYFGKTLLWIGRHNPARLQKLARDETKPQALRGAANCVLSYLEAIAAGQVKPRQPEDQSVGVRRKG